MDQRGTESSAAPDVRASAEDQRSLKKPWSSATLFTWAGVLITASCMLYELLGLCRPAVDTGLALLLVAFLLGLAAMHRSTREKLAAPTNNSGGSLWLIFALLLVLHAVATVAMCRATNPRIDTLTFQRNASKMLLAGVDPYGKTEPFIYDNASLRYYGTGMVVNGQVQVGLQYPPLSLLWVVPGYLLGDVRYSFIFAVLLSAVLMFTAFPGQRSLWASAILLLNPITMLVEVKCWTEPLVLLAICATLVTARKWPRWLPVALGLFLATKQYSVLALPFAASLLNGEKPFSWKAYWRLVGVSCAVAAVTLLPFAIWNAQGLWHDLILFHLAQPFRSDAMSLATFLPFLLKVGPVLLLVYLIWAIRSGTRNTATFAAGFALALMIFFLFGKQAFSNYYFLIAQLFFFYPALHTQLPARLAGARNTESLTEVAGIAKS
jgi:hypothetical protein